MRLTLGFLIILFFTSCVNEKKYIGTYYGIQNNNTRYDSVYVSISLHINKDHTYTYDCFAYDSLNHKEFNKLQMIPMHTYGRWLVYKSKLYLTELSDTFCHEKGKIIFAGENAYFRHGKGLDEETNWKYSKRLKRKIGRTVKCNGEDVIIYDSYSTLQFDNNNKRPLKLNYRMKCDSWEEIWTGDTTYIRKE